MRLCACMHIIMSFCAYICVPLCAFAFVYKCVRACVHACVCVFPHERARALWQLFVGGPAHCLPDDPCRRNP